MRDNLPLLLVHMLAWCLDVSGVWIDLQTNGMLCFVGKSDEALSIAACDNLKTIRHGHHVLQVQAMRDNLSI